MRLRTLGSSALEWPARPGFRTGSCSADRCKPCSPPTGLQQRSNAISGLHSFRRTVWTRGSQSSPDSQQVENQLEKAYLPAAKSVEAADPLRGITASLYTIAAWSLLKWAVPTSIASLGQLGSAEELNAAAWVLALTIQLGLDAASLWAIIRLISPHGLRSGLRMSSTGLIAGALPTTLILLGLVGALVAPGQVPVDVQTDVRSALSEGSLWVKAPAVLDLSIIGPVLEELLFRGLLQNALLLLLPDLLAVVMSAAIFSAFHLDASGLGVNFVLGLILGAVSLKGGRSIWASALPHGAYNLVLLILTLQQIKLV